MIQIISFEESYYCPQCGDFTNSSLELVEIDGEEVMQCPFCGYEEGDEENVE